ncbi:LIM domain protein [Teladorsagia circumcincta]|uniref:LIM domain protein n=1 Tax=Teladorsagia circumcincta TaxID=45464 RepID=A0A2G9TLQ2_TELCI|nr:LIM domain protein [Teladorsagia circumcincta]
MLGTLNSEYSSKHGISTIPKGDCGQCGKPIIGQVVIALGKMWHPEHYTCCECGSELGHRNFFERNGRAYCEEDYHNQFSPRCAGCNGPIKDRCVTALGKNFHLQCFTCSECGREFGDDGFHEKVWFQRLLSFWYCRGTVVGVEC